MLWLNRRRSRTSTRCQRHRIRHGRAPSASYRIRGLQLSRGQLLRVDDHLRPGFLELIKVASLDILILHPEHARVLPFAVWRIFDLADDGIEAVRLEVIAEFSLVEAANRRYRLLHHLAVRVGKGRNEIAEQICAD